MLRLFNVSNKVFSAANQQGTPPLLPIKLKGRITKGWAAASSSHKNFKGEEGAGPSETTRRARAHKGYVLGEDIVHAL